MKQSLSGNDLRVRALANRAIEFAKAAQIFRADPEFDQLRITHVNIVGKDGKKAVAVYAEGPDAEALMKWTNVRRRNRSR